MIRKIVEIHEEKCNGCGLCADACHEGAIAIIDGVAKLTRDDYCDGMGDCLPDCPTGAIEIIEREAVDYDQAAVEAKLAAEGKTYNPNAHAEKEAERMMKILNEKQVEVPEQAGHGCPGSRARAISHAPMADAAPAQAGLVSRQSRLQNWPVQIKLAPVVAPYFDGANLLVAADCTAYAYGAFHDEFIKNHVTLIGCPKLDDWDYTDKLQAIIERNNIKSLTVVRMQVPCCGGLEHAAVNALKNSGKFIPWRVVTITHEGEILE
ncbi:MAG: 4Fe-4S binding protein [Eubacterium sp.]|nr:4Fe-4S binding protein [Eubacterium sp.]